MKGIVFTELTEMLDQKFSMEFTEEILAETELSSGGSYTAVGTYDHHEMIALVTTLSRKTGLAGAELQKMFGGHLFNSFLAAHPAYFQRCRSARELLASVNDVIHVEVRKLHVDAELPEFAHRYLADGTFELEYRSKRPFADLAEGLIAGCIAHYGDPVELQRTDLSSGEETRCVFRLQPIA